MSRPPAESPGSFPDPKPREAFPGSLEEEARWVADGMSRFRDQWVRRLTPTRTGETRCHGNRPGSRGPSSSRPQPERPASRERPFGFSPFYYYPFLFAGAFPSLPPETLRSIALANRILLEAVLLLDRHMDESRPWSPEEFFLADTCYQRAMEHLLGFFPPGHPFWPRAEELYFEYGRAILREQTRHRFLLSPYDDREFYEISIGKTALIRTTLIALSLLARDDRPLAPLIESQNRFLAGFQAFDDLKDWKEDLRHRLFTQLLTTVLVRGRFAERVRQGDLPPESEVGLILYYRGAAEEQLEKAECYLRESLARARGAPVPLWREMVRGFLKNCRVMRNDLAEIRRREQSRGPQRPKRDPEGAGIEPAAAGSPTRTAGIPPAKEIEQSILQAVAYLTRAWQTRGGFTPARSRYPYLNPATCLPPSSAIASLVLGALAPLRRLDPRLAALFGEEARRTGPSGVSPPATPGLPRSLEEIFGRTDYGPQDLLRLDRGFSPDTSLSSHGLFWANLLVLAAGHGVTLPAVEAAARACVAQADYGRWTRATPGPHPTTRSAPAREAAPAVSRPLLPVLLFCQGLGPKLLDPSLRKPLHASLSARVRTEGTWGNVTDTALTLLCLSATACADTPLAPAAEKLLRAQEPDGSWPPNAVFAYDGQYFGGRDLTTAWCAAALFLYGLSRLPDRAAHPELRPPAPEPLVAVLPHPGLCEEFPSRAQRAQERCREILRGPWPRELYLGCWNDMPAHFLLPREGGPVLGINLLSPRGSPCLSSSGRPLEVEVALALTAAARYLLRGPLRDRLERMFVSGLGLSLSETLWPEVTPWRHAGMPEMDWLWCREHEPWLWEELRRFLEHPLPKPARFRWLLPDWRPRQENPVPAGAQIYLGRRLAADYFPQRASRERFSGLLEAGHDDILRSFRGKVGLRNTGPAQRLETAVPRPSD